MSTQELLSYLQDEGSLTLQDTLEIKETRYGRYSINALGEDKVNRIYLKRDVDESDINLYLKAVSTIQKWKEEGYSGVNGWEYHKNRQKHIWRTPNDHRSVKISTRHIRAVKARKVPSMFIGGFLNGSAHVNKVDLSVAIILHKMKPRKFEYNFSKYYSMYQNLQDITGIGKNISEQLLKEYNCSSYEDVNAVLTKTNIPKNYLYDARSGIKEKIESGEQLIDESVVREYSDIIVSKNI